MKLDLRCLLILSLRNFAHANREEVCNYRNAQELDFFTFQKPQASSLPSVSVPPRSSAELSFLFEKLYKNVCYI